MAYPGNPFSLQAVGPIQGNNNDANMVAIIICDYIDDEPADEDDRQKLRWGLKQLGPSLHAPMVHAYTRTYRFPNQRNGL